VIIVGVASTITVYRMTKKAPVTRVRSEPSDVDKLDEGSAE